MVHRAHIALATRGHQWPASNHRQTRSGPCRDEGTPTQTVSLYTLRHCLSEHSFVTVNSQRSPSITSHPFAKYPHLLSTHPTAHTPVMKSLHSVGSRMHSSWAAAASDPSEECMVTVSTLERQHMASWSGTSTSNRATLSRGSHKRPGTDPSHNGHPPTNSTEKREHCKCQSSWGHICGHTLHIMDVIQCKQVLPISAGRNNMQVFTETALQF